MHARMPLARHLWMIRILAFDDFSVPTKRKSGVKPFAQSA